VALPAGPAHAQPDAWLSSPLHADILMSALSYSRTLKRMPGPTLPVGVLFDPGVEEAVRGSAAVVSRLEALAKRMTFHGKRIVVRGIPLLASDELLEATLREVAVVYLVPGLSARDLGRVTAASRRAGVVTASASASFVRRGVSLGITLRLSKPKILVNLAANKAEGADFSSRLLRLAEVIGRGPGAP